MRMSCSGCRVLRKGCTDGCSIRPCLQWIKSPQSQAHATVFLAKFYGRAGLINLIDAGPEHLRPAIFRSLLYEACGRMVNPVHGATGLLWSGSWQLCQAAVEAVLKGAPITQAPSGAAASAGPVPPLPKASSCDIRHVAKGDVGAAAATQDLDRTRKGNLKRPRREEDQLCDRGTVRAKRHRSAVEADRSPDRNQPSSPGRSPVGGGTGLCDGDGESVTMASVETAEEASMVTSRVDAGGGNTDPGRADGNEIELELTLGFEPFHCGRRQSLHRSSSDSRRRHTADNRGHSPTCSSSSSAATEATEEYERHRGIRVGGNMLGIDLRLDLAA